MKKLWKALCAVVLVLPLFIGVFGTKTANATEATTNVTLNKRIWKDGEAPAQGSIQNTGEEMDFGGEPLNGAEFTVYDVTSAYYDLLKDKTQDETVKYIAENETDYMVNKVEAKTTAGAGQATFALPETKDGKDAVYLFVETKTPGDVTVTKKAAPFVLAMPLYKMNKDGSYTDEKLDNVNIYPKNETVTDKKTVTNIDEFTVTGEDGTVYNMERGQKIDFQLTLNIPTDIKDVTYSVTDTPTAGLELVENSLTANLDKDSYSIKSNDDGGFTLTLDSTKADVQALAGSTLTVKYQMELVKDLTPDAIENNKATVNVGGENQPSITPNEKFQTGGKKIVKKDSQSGKTLAGAEFVVVNSEGKYGEFELNDKNQYALIGWSEEQNNKTKVTSLSDGTLNVVGLKDGTYTLNETKAPSDKYVKIPDGTVKFTVKAGTYDTVEIKVENTAKGLLPSTGGNGIYAFLLVGAALMAGAYIWFKKSKTQAEV